MGYGNRQHQQINSYYSRKPKITQLTEKLRRKLHFAALKVLLGWEKFNIEQVQVLLKDADPKLLVKDKAWYSRLIRVTPSTKVELPCTGPINLDTVTKRYPILAKLDPIPTALAATGPYDFVHLSSPTKSDFSTPCSNMYDSTDFDSDFDQFFFLDNNETKEISEKATPCLGPYTQSTDSLASPSHTPARFNKKDSELTLFSDEGQSEFRIISPLVSEKSFNNDSLLPVMNPLINKIGRFPPKNLTISTNINVSKNNSTIYNSYGGQLTPSTPITPYTGNENFPSYSYEQIYEPMVHFEPYQNFEYSEIATKIPQSLKEGCDSGLMLTGHSAWTEEDRMLQNQYYGFIPCIQPFYPWYHSHSAGSNFTF
ncbi:hypothetical protein HK096_010560 [Nowakowskiella sp. JEL0078]|nr:hypothetical protein HK096_010560 [Nowakowskiella sp. JEL0078]